MPVLSQQTQDQMLVNSFCLLGYKRTETMAAVVLIPLLQTIHALVRHVSVAHWNWTLQLSLWDQPVSAQLPQEDSECFTGQTVNSPFGPLPVRPLRLGPLPVEPPEYYKHGNALEVSPFTPLVPDFINHNTLYIMSPTRVAYLFGPWT